MTWAQLKELVNGMDDALLARPVLYLRSGEDTGGRVTGVDVMEEDQVNPGGDEWMARATYEAECRFEDPSVTQGILDRERSVAIKGQVVLSCDEEALAEGKAGR